jgi:hypothetical protein
MFAMKSPTSKYSTYPNIGGPYYYPIIPGLTHSPEPEPKGGIGSKGICSIGIAVNGISPKEPAGGINEILTSPSLSLLLISDVTDCPRSMNFSFFEMKGNEKI